MDKYDYKLKTEQMLELMDNGAYNKAAEVADTIDWKRVRNATILTNASDIYERNGAYQKSYEVLNIAYHKTEGSRKVLYRLCALAIKTGNVDEAIDYYDDFMQVAPKDPNQHILKYKILSARKAPIDERIEALEEFKKAEYIEEWAYELAKLYQEAGMTAECLEECDDLILWFSEGKYVFKAMELKMQYKPLTPSQQERYDHRYEKIESVTEEIPDVKVYHMKNETRDVKPEKQNTNGFYEEEPKGTLVQDVTEEFDVLEGLEGLDEPEDSDVLKNVEGLDGMEKFDALKGMEGLDEPEEFDALKGMEGLDVTEEFDALKGVKGLDVTEEFDALKGMEGLDVTEEFDALKGVEGLDEPEELDALKGLEGLDVTEEFDALKGMEGLDGTEEFKVTKEADKTGKFVVPQLLIEPEEPEAPAEPEEPLVMDETVQKLTEKGIGIPMKLGDALKSLLQPKHVQSEQHEYLDEDEEEVPELEAAIEEIESVADLDLVNEITGKSERARIHFDSDLEELKAEPLPEENGQSIQEEEPESFEDVSDELLEELEAIPAELSEAEGISNEVEENVNMQYEDGDDFRDITEEALLELDGLSELYESEALEEDAEELLEDESEVLEDSAEELPQSESKELEEDAGELLEADLEKPEEGAEELLWGESKELEVKAGEFEMDLQLTEECAENLPECESEELQEKQENVEESFEDALEVLEESCKELSKNESVVPGESSDRLQEVLSESLKENSEDLYRDESAVLEVGAEKLPEDTSETLEEDEGLLEEDAEDFVEIEELTDTKSVVYISKESKDVSDEPDYIEETPNELSDLSDETEENVYFKGDGIEAAILAENIKPEGMKPEDDQIEGQLSIEELLKGIVEKSAEEVEMEENKKKTEPILPPDIQRLIDEIEGVVPQESEPEAVNSVKRNVDEPRTNIGDITQQLKTDDISEYLKAEGQQEDNYHGDVFDVEAEDYVDSNSEEEYAEEDYFGKAVDDGAKAVYFTDDDGIEEDEYAEDYKENEYTDVENEYEEEYEEDEYTDEYEEDEYSDEYEEDEYVDEYEEDEYSDEYEEDEYSDEYEEDEYLDEFEEDEYSEKYEEDEYSNGDGEHEDSYGEDEYSDEYMDEDGVYAGEEQEYSDEQYEEYDDEEYDAANGYEEEDYGDIEASFEEEFRPNPEHVKEPDDREIPDDDEGMDILSATTPLSRKETAKLIATGKTAPLPMDEISDALSMSDTGFVVHGRYDLAAQSGIGTRAGLTEEQKKLFSYFVPVRGMSEQLVDVLEQDINCTNREGTSRTGNLLIIGNKGNGKTVLAVDVVKAIQKQRNIRQGKVAIVTGDSLNKKKISDIFEKLHGGALIVEKAAKMNEKTVARLNKAMERNTGEMMVVLEEQRKPLDRLLSSNREFRRKFTSRLEVPIFINDELVTFGQTYAQENGYRIDEMGILALYSRIDALQREDHAVSIAEVKEVMDEAMEHSQKASAKKLVKRVFGKNTDDADRIILSEKDFNI